MKPFVLSLCLLLLFVTGCANEPSAKLPSSSESWAFLFVVLNGTFYIQTNEHTDVVNQQVGTINDSRFSDEDVTFNPTDTFTNAYPLGAKLYALPGKSETDYIAVQNKDGNYDVLKKHGKYAPKEPVQE